MKLSDAILEGCKGTEKIQGKFFLAEEKDGQFIIDTNKCCVLGAAAKLLGAKDGYDCRDILINTYPDLFPGGWQSQIIIEAVDRNNKTDESGANQSPRGWPARGFK